MVTIGDSFSIVATLAGLAVTLWAFLVACALLFPARVASARNAVSTHTSACIGTGFAAFLVGFFGIVVLQVPNPGVKLFGMIMVSSYFAMVAIGSSGIAKLASERLRSLKGDHSNLFDSYAKSALYIVVAGMLPILGWFLFAPIFMLTAGGAGLLALLKPATANEVA
ncbi:MAG: hypothetical protein GC165_06035 [Armatimonadetes bacterium]|nr:hypothetical protein [Armatimonadota bacterium]MBS1725086.1 hypothetical protein [Armatimonadota bacterium]